MARYKTDYSSIWYLYHSIARELGWEYVDRKYLVVDDIQGIKLHILYYKQDDKEFFIILPERKGEYAILLPPIAPIRIKVKKD